MKRRNRSSHYILVAIDWPASISPEFAAEMVEMAMQRAKDDGVFQIVHGNGPNPPYEADCEGFTVYPDERP